MKRSKIDDEKEKLKLIEEKRRKLEEERIKKEEERLKREEEKRKREEEKEKDRLRKEEEKRKREEERLKREEEKKRLADEKEQQRLKREEEKRKKDEEKEQERLKKEEEKRKKEEERKQKEEEKERERLKREEERKQKEEEKERERLKREEEKLKKEQEKLKLQEEAERKKLQQASFLKNFLNKTTPTRKSGGKSYRPDSSTVTVGDDEVMEVSENDNPNSSLSDDTKLPSIPRSKFRPFQVKNGMALAPLLRRPCLNSSEKTSVDKIVSFADEPSAHNNSQMSIDETEVVEIRTAELIEASPSTSFQPYLESIKKGRGRKSQRTEVQNHQSDEEEEEDEDDDIKIVEVDPKKVLSENIKGTGLVKWRYKLLQFHDNRRPAYWGTWKRKSHHVNPRRPLGRDRELDYEFDSDDEWEDEPEDGEDLGDKDDDDKAEDEKESSKLEGQDKDDDEDEEDDWMVPHGYLSDDEGDGVEYRDKDYLKSQEERYYQDLKREDKLGLPVVVTEHEQLVGYEFIFPPEDIPDGGLQESEDDSDED